MSRNSGTFDLSGSFEPQMAQTLDARQLVPTKADLVLDSTWDKGKGVFLPVGFFTSVWNDSDPSNNGIYTLVAADYKVSTNWQKLGGGDSSSVLYDGQVVNEIVAGPNVMASVADGVLMVSATDGDRLNNANIGEIFWWSLPTPPSNALWCNGSAVSRTEYSALFSVIGVLFGEGDGETTFNLPDMRGEFVRGYDPDAIRDYNGATRMLGEHQSGTEHVDFELNANTSLQVGYGTTTLRASDADSWSMSTSKGYQRIAVASRISDPYTRTLRYTSRPTNINLLPCIRCKNEPNTNTQSTPTNAPLVTQQLKSLGIQPAETIQEQTQQLNELGVQ